MRKLLYAVSAFVLSATQVQAQSPEALDTELAAVQAEWAGANYATPAGEARIQAFEALSKRAEALVKAFPSSPEPLIWQGIVLSTYAGAKGGLGALGFAKQSRAALEAALKLDPQALQGSAYTSLGTLYYKVPGFPLGFGNKNKAREYLQRALAINPHGIDPNFFYAEFLFEQDEYGQALEHLRKALHAPPRPGRELADAGRRKEIEALMARVQKKSGRLGAVARRVESEPAT
jgi:tetratricopeptide (TPR) repeat protein